MTGSNLSHLPPPRVPRAQESALGHIIGYLVFGLVFVVSAGAYVWISSDYTLCSSAIGILGQAFSAAAQQDCGRVTLIHTASVVGMVFGVFAVGVNAAHQLYRKALRGSGE